MHHMPLWVALPADGDDGARLPVAWLLLYPPAGHPGRLAHQHDLLYKFLLNKWYFDELYDLIFVRPAMWLGRCSGRAATAG